MRFERKMYDCRHPISVRSKSRKHIELLGSILTDEKSHRVVLCFTETLVISYPRLRNCPGRFCGYIDHFSSIFHFIIMPVSRGI